MSTNILCQIWHEKRVDNKELSEVLVNLLRENYGLAKKDVARELHVDTWRVHNWFYRKTGLAAFDLVMLMWRYGHIYQNVQELMLMPFGEWLSI